MSSFRKRVFYNNTPSYKRETKFVKCHGVCLNRTHGSYVIRQNNKKTKNIVRLLFPHKTKETYTT